MESSPSPRSNDSNRIEKYVLHGMELSIQERLAIVSILGRQNRLDPAQAVFMREDFMEDMQQLDASGTVNEPLHGTLLDAIIELDLIIAGIDNER